MMNVKIKILIAEHEASDIELLCDELKSGGIDFISVVVKTATAFTDAIREFIPDLILSDYAFPNFSGATAFMIREELAPDTPFIIVSGTIGEETSVEMIKKGISDYVLKDKLFTLVPKVIRALKESADWKEKKEVQKQLVLSEALLAEAQAIAKTGSWVTDLSDLSVKWSRETFRIYGMEEQSGSISHAAFLNMVHPGDRLFVETAFNNSLDTHTVNTFEHRIITSAGELKIVEENWKIIRDEQGIPVHAMGSCQEITERKQLEAQRESERANLADAQKLAHMGSWDYNILTDCITWSDALYFVFDVDKKAFGNCHRSFFQLIDESDRKRVEQVVRNTEITGDPFTIEYSITTPSGEKRVIQEHGHGRKDETGRVIHLFGTAQNISEAKRYESAILLACEEKNTVLESIDDGFFAVDKNSLITYWNKKAEELLGKKREDVIGKNLHELFDGNDSNTFYENYQKATRTNATVRFESFSILSDKWFAVSVFPSENGLSVYFKDVTEQKNAAEKIKESELRYRSLIEQATDTICILNESGEFFDINPSGCSMFGYSKEEILKLAVADVLFEDDLRINPIRMKELKAGYTTSNERRIRRKDGTTVEVELSAKMIEEGRILVFGRDISSRKEAERLIKESEAKYRSFFESSMDGILLTVADGAILSANPAACEIFKMTEDEICAAGRMGVADLSDPRLFSLLEERQRTGKAKGELTLLRKDGSQFEAELTSAEFTDSFGLSRTSMILRDISQRKAAEFKLTKTSKELQHALNDLNKIMDFSMDIICTVDAMGNFVQVSAASEAIWGYSQQELININYIGIVHADDVEKTIAKNTEVKSGVSITMFENHFVHKNGSMVPMLWSANWDENDQLMYCIGKDATEKKRLEKANEIERQRFLGLYLQAPSSMGILKGPNHVYELANPLYLQLIAKTDIIGKTVKEVLPEMEGQGILDVLDTVYQTGNTFSANEMLVKFDFNGNGILVDTYLNFIYQAHRNHEGDINGIVFFAIDVTEQVLSRRKIEESGRRYRQIVETAQEGIWLIDENHITTFVNSKMFEIFEYTETEMLGKDIYFFMDEEGKKIAADLMEMKKEGQAGQGHFKYISKSGKEVWTNLSANPIFDENGIYKGSLAMVTDITQSKKAEMLIKESNERYKISEIQLTQLNANLQVQARKLAVSNADLEQFAYVASHDLQEPLRMVTSFLTMLQKKYGTVIDEKGKQYIEFAVDGARRMRLIILDLLEFSRVGRTEDLLEEIDLNEIVNEIQVLFRKQIMERKAVIISNALPVVLGYRSPLRQVFQNLISNALKYARKDQTTRINIDCTEVKDHWQFAVKDNGIGIEKEYFEKIFIIFQRLHNKNEFSGTGMGLAVTKKIIENFGGKISVASEVGKGSIFYFTIPKRIM